MPTQHLPLSFEHFDSSTSEQAMSQLSQHETTAPKSASSKKAKRPRDEFETGSATKLESAGRKKKKKTAPDSASPDSEEQASQSPTSSRPRKHSISGLQAGTVVVVDPRTASGEKHVQSSRKRVSAVDAVL